MNSDYRIPHRHNPVETGAHRGPEKGRVTLGFAILLIVAIGSVLAGVLALNQVVYIKEIGSIGAQIALYGGVALALITLIVKVCAFYQGKRVPLPDPQLEQKVPSEPLLINHQTENDLFTALKANLRGQKVTLLLKKRPDIPIPWETVPWQLSYLIFFCFEKNDLNQIKMRIGSSVEHCSEMFSQLTPQVREALIILILKELAKNDPLLNICMMEDLLNDEPIEVEKLHPLVPVEEYPQTITFHPNGNFDQLFEFSNFLKKPHIIYFPGNVKTIEPHYIYPSYLKSGVLAASAAHSHLPLKQWSLARQPDFMKPPCQFLQISNIQSIALPLPNNSLPDFLITEPKRIPKEEAKELPPVACARFEEFPTFFKESQEAFKESVIGYLNSKSNGAIQHFTILKEARESSLLTVQKIPEVVVIGGGPSGLVAALEAYLAGSRVYLIEKRNCYSRDTMLRLRIDTALYLKERLGDHLYAIAETNELIKTRTQGGFEKEFFGSEAFIVIETKILEWLLAMILFELAKRDEAIKIYREWEFSDLKDEKHSTYVKIKNSASVEFTIPCDFLIGADGAKSQVREKSGIGWNPKSKARPSLALTFTNLWANNFAYQELDFVPQCITNAFKFLTENDKSESLKIASNEVFLTIQPHIASIEWEKAKDQRFDTFMQSRKSRYGNEITSKDEIVKKETQLAQVGGNLLHGELQSLGWELKRLPSNRIFSSTHTIYLGTDIPKKLIDTNLSTLTPWISTILEQNLPRSAIKILLPQIRNYTTFYSQLFQALSVRQGRIFLIGDAVGTPDFQTGSGAKKAIDDGLAIGKLIYQFGHSKNYETDLSQYEKEAELRTNKLHEKSFEWGFSEKLK